MEAVPSCSVARRKPGPDADERDPDVLRAALTRETAERRRAECLAHMQTEVVQLALDLLVREPDIDGFFGGLTKTMVDEGDSHTCGVWLLDEEHQRAELWMAYVRDRLYTRQSAGGCDTQSVPCAGIASQLYFPAPGLDHNVQDRRADTRHPPTGRA